MKRTIKVILNTFSGVVVAVAVVFSLLLAGPGFIGYKNFIVTSASMEPNIMTGSMIYVSPQDSVDDYKVNDVISFYLDDSIIATHRIVDIEETDDTEAGFAFITKGDKNENNDPSPVDPSRVIGKCVFTIPYLGYVYTYIRNPPGIYVVISIATLVLASMILPGIFFSDDDEKEKQSEDFDAEKE